MEAQRGWSSQCWFSHGAIPEQGLSSAAAWASEAKLLQLLVPCQTHAGFASTCWGSCSLSHVQVWQQQGRDFEVNNTLCLWSLDASIYNQHRVWLPWLNVFVNAHISYYVLLIALSCFFFFFLVLKKDTNRWFKFLRIFFSGSKSLNFWRVVPKRLFLGLMTGNQHG